MQRTSIIAQSIYAVSKEKYQNFGKVLYLNGLLLVNISFGMAATSIVPEIAEQMGYNQLGQVIVLFQYLMGMIGNVFAPTYLKKLSYKWAFFLLAFAGTFQCIIGVFITIAYNQSFGIGLTYFGCLFFSTINGLCYGGLWVAQNLYISENSNNTNKALYFGIANSLSNSANLIGSLTSIYVLKFFEQYNNGQLYYFIVLFFLSLGTQFLYFLVLQPPAKHLTNHVLKEAELQSNINIQQSEISDTQYSLIKQSSIDQEVKERISQLHKHPDYETIEFFNDLPLLKQLSMIWDVTKSKKVRNILPYMFSTGLVLGFEYGVYYKLITLCIDNTFPQYIGNSTEIQIKTFIVFGCQGTTEIFGGIVIGILGDNFLINYVSIIQSAMIHFVMFLTLIDCFIQSYGIAIAFGLLWGFADCAGQANCMSLLSEDWGDDVRVFGLYNFSQNFGAIMAILLSIIMNGLDFYYYLLILFLWMIFSNYNMNLYRRYNRIKEYEINN